MSLEIKIPSSTGYLKTMDSLELQGLCHIITFPTAYHTPAIAFYHGQPCLSVAGLNISS